jgi:hypothetical protein
MTGDPMTGPPGLALIQQRLSGLMAERARRVAESDATPSPVTVLLLLRRLDLADLVQGARVFVAGLSAEEAGSWLRSWTRTRFLFGIPDNLTEHARPRVVSPAGSAAWLGPHPLRHLPGPSRLLKPLSGTLPPLPPVLDIPPGVTGVRRGLHLATRDLTLVGYLVHLHHTIAEATLLGRLSAAEPLRIVHHPDLDAGLLCGTAAYARVHHVGDDPSQLRLYTWLAP